jgi:hypothetical protein
MCCGFGQPSDAAAQHAENAKEAGDERREACGKRVLREAAGAEDLGPTGGGSSEVGAEIVTPGRGSA